jgi:isoaspartyl peptidase/L-asparaginase-like protein (Ntn-hydrolase superfamily)
VQAAIEILKDNPLFNAGRGSVFAANGANQMDAAIMDGAAMKAGAVADVQHTRHPIDLARAVMDKSPNVMMIGPGADAFAVRVGLQQEPRSFFFTEHRWPAVSAIGSGEYFIRLTVARIICALVQYRHMSLQAAVNDVVQKQLAAIHGDGGVIALTPDGQLAWSFNTPGMFRAKLQQDGKVQFGIYRDEP